VLRPALAITALGLALGAAEGPLRLETPGGEPVALAPRAPDETLVVHFWATWCRDCDAELATLESLAPRCQGRPVRILAVNAGEEREVVRRFVDERGLHLEILLDPRGRAWRRTTGGAGLPANLVWTERGSRADVGAKTRAAWESELGAVTVEFTGAWRTSPGAKGVARIARAAARAKASPSLSTTRKPCTAPSARTRTASVASPCRPRSFSAAG
jgi:thiol-disulfide isomerase/thioredoxin